MDRHVEPLDERVHIERGREHSQSHHEELGHLRRTVGNRTAGKRATHQAHPVVHLLVLRVDPKVNTVHFAECQVLACALLVREPVDDDRVIIRVKPYLALLVLCDEVSYLREVAFLLRSSGDLAECGPVFL